MFLNILRSKIHRAEITDSSLHYEGSLGIDIEFMQMIGLRPYEKILCSNINNGNRFETYAIPAPAGGKGIILNGAAAHMGKVGDLLVIMSFASMTEEEAATWKPKVLVLGEGNQKIVKLQNQ